MCYTILLDKENKIENIYIENIFILDYDKNWTSDKNTHHPLAYDKDSRNILVLLDNEKIEINSQNLFITLIRYKYGYNLRLKKNVDEYFTCDGGELEDNYPKIVEIIQKTIKEKYPKEPNESILDELSNVENSKYLFHQHLWKYNKEGKFCKPKIEWSIYEYEANTKDVMNMWLDVDTYILQRHVMYYSSAHQYITLIDNENTTIKNIRSMLNNDRCMIANHELEQQDFSSLHISTMNDPLQNQNTTLFDLHRIIPTQKTYEKLDNDLLHYAEEQERKQQYETSRTLEIIVFIMTLLGVVSIVASLISLITTKPFFHDTNTTTEIGLIEAWNANHLNSTITWIILGMIFLIILVYILHKILYKKSFFSK